MITARYVHGSAVDGASVDATDSSEADRGFADKIGKRRKSQGRVLDVETLALYEWSEVRVAKILSSRKIADLHSPSNQPLQDYVVYADFRTTWVCGIEVQLSSSSTQHRHTQLERNGAANQVLTNKQCIIPGTLPVVPSGLDRTPSMQPLPCNKQTRSLPAFLVRCLLR